MRCKILHESKGRIRVHVMQNRMTMEQADKLEYYLKGITEITDAKVFDRTADIIITYLNHREVVLEALSRFSYESFSLTVPEHTGREINRVYEDRLILSVLWHYFKKLFIPLHIRIPMDIIRSAKYIYKGICSVLKGQANVELLDAIAIGVSMARNDFSTASSVMFMLGLGELLEEWTHKKSVDDLARTMSLNVEKVWTIVDGQEILVSINDVSVGDKIVVRTGSLIPLDGKVVAGEATVNQASITGESMAVRKEIGSYAYAGTAVEEGQCVICVDKNSGTGRYDRIVRMIEETEKLKSNTENKAATLADKLVPYSLLATVATYGITRNITKAISILMVDFSCALKLAMPIAVLSAMRESSYYNIFVKGGKFLEAVSQADTIVFDKTGTLTHAAATVAKVIPFSGRDENEMLRLAACLEEHYPHSMANAVVEEANKRELHHEERHTKVEYVVAHGISSMVDGEKVVIGSKHFIFQDEGCVVDKEDEELFNNLSNEYSHLYLAVSGKLAAVICIEDPLREEANAVITSLQKLGLKNIVMMTGDNYHTAKAIAEKVGINEFYAEVLPEDKAEFVKRRKAEGHKVIMIGDGINDAPALSQADAGIAISDGAAIAREIADITISADDLFSLVTLKYVSDALMKRIDNSYNFIITFNGMLILLGVFGILTPTTSALLHNVSTLGISVQNMTNLLE